MTGPLSPRVDRPGQGHRNRHRIELCCDPDRQLVYLRTLKCASTFFYRNLCDNLGWKELAWNEINWRNQHVFSHMLHPVTRRHKGIAEKLHMLGLNDGEFMQDPRVQNLLRFVPLLDEHTSTYWDTYGTACWSIDWIPLTGGFEENIDRTNLLLESYGVATDRWDISLRHESDDDKQNLVQQLANMWATQTDPPDFVIQYLEKDLRLWRGVTHNFNPAADNWWDMSWLTSTHWHWRHGAV